MRTFVHLFIEGKEGENKNDKKMTVEKTANVHISHSRNRLRLTSSLVLFLFHPSKSFFIVGWTKERKGRENGKRKG